MTPATLREEVRTAGVSTFWTFLICLGICADPSPDIQTWGIYLCINNALGSSSPTLGDGIAAFYVALGNNCNVDSEADIVLWLPRPWYRHRWAKPEEILESVVDSVPLCGSRVPVSLPGGKGCLLEVCFSVTVNKVRLQIASQGRRKGRQTQNNL